MSKKKKLRILLCITIFSAATPSSNNMDTCISDRLTESQCLAIICKEQKCFFYGNSSHLWQKCPAWESAYNGCSKKYHFAKKCHSASLGMSAIFQSLTLAVVVVHRICTDDYYLDKIKYGALVSEHLDMRVVLTAFFANLWFKIYICIIQVLIIL